jgi:hypothetical protein
VPLRNRCSFTSDAIQRPHSTRTPASYPDGQHPELRSGGRTDGTLPPARESARYRPYVQNSDRTGNTPSGKRRICATSDVRVSDDTRERASIGDS